MSPKKTGKVTSNTGLGSLPPGAHALAAIGTKTAEVVQQYFSTRTGSDLFDTIPHQDLRKLAGAFTAEWTDDNAAVVIREYLDAVRANCPIDLIALTGWVLSHPNEPDAIRDCIKVEPPPEITIIRVLSRAGSQKLVFLATWQLTQREVVLKRLVGPPEAVARIIGREAQSHPLSITHDHIIETHPLRNRHGEVFLVEEKLPQILRDDWRAPGTEEAVNLLYHIADALSHLHTKLGLVHGDVKPDNIGKRGEKYILLDFGICRPARDFTRNTTPTGSLRTRAPELFERDEYVSPEKVDVWALGATVYNAVVGRYPLFDRGEKPPRISTPEERNRFEAELRRRVAEEWDKRVTFDDVDQVLRGLLVSAMQKDPNRRCTAHDLLDQARRDLPAHLRTSKEIRRFSPKEELDQLAADLPVGRALAVMPQAEKEALLAKLHDLRGIPGFSEDECRRIDALVSNLG